MKRYRQLKDAEDHWVTHMGAWFAGERVVFRGQDLHIDLKDMSWMALFIFGITGKRFTENQLNVLNAIWTCTSFPDPRIWNNRVAALAGTVRTTPALGISAALAVSEAGIYGHGPCVNALDLVKRACQAVESGVNLARFLENELAQGKILFGFGRPITGIDERIPHLLSIVEENGLHKGKHLTLIQEIEKFLLQGRRKLRLNVAGIFAGLIADFDFSLDEYYQFIIPLFLAGMPPIYLEAKQKPIGTFFPLSCERITYYGRGSRSWQE